ncbi:M48 family metallopeptidase [Nocardioides bizhenqiangii]|uniref:M48 family metallopeptidase n=1 Tax=Nocardioides bizhenqiangii TaxID=3095076 RepID=A0ABZ0ZL70_9ACTN|nr:MULTISPECIES: M48 family metallopeptidase [unclassified Nocardioides]MDZ5620706.1 M48 family metallopeptidase [Nocardioides sp. HM23]WQQ25072.1 M48 family metallopeptidase [Nocardioides sp. HM61]
MAEVQTPTNFDTTEGRIALGTTMIGIAAFVLLATWLVPWNPVPGGTPDPVPADAVFRPDQVERAEDYARWARVWGWSSLLVSLAVVCWLGFSARGRRLADRMPGPWWARVILVVTALEVIGRLVTLPLAIAQRRLQLDAGLSTSSWPAWALDLVKSELVDVVTTSIALVVLFAVARRWTRAWPAIAGGLLAVFVVAGSFVYPVLVEPLFNSFTPLEDGPLRTQILELAEREGVEVDDVLVADASRRTTTLNAYVSGYGETRRVVVYDTLVDDLDDQQALSVVAHELSHDRHDDVLLGTFLGAAGVLAGVGLLGLLTGVAERRGRPRVGEVGAVPMILALAAIAAVLASPLQNGISRQIETRADVDALRATNAPQPFVALQRRLAIKSLADPTPPGWSQWWFGSHPTVLERIAIARSVDQRR